MAVTHIPSLSLSIKSTLRREFIVAGRNLSELANPWVFFVAVAIFIPLAISPDAQVLGLIAPGMVWIIALLAVLLSLEHIFQRDLENGCLEQMIISGQSMYWLVIAKTFAHWLFTGLPLTIFSPILAMMLSMPDQGYGVMVVSLFFGTGALSFLGAIGAAVTVALRRGGLLISLIIIPFYLPVLIFGAAAVRNSIDGISVNSPVAVLAMFWLASILFAPLATAAALKVGLQE